MYVIGHDCECVQFDASKSLWKRLPDTLRLLSGGIAVHFTVTNGAKKVLPLSGTDGDKVVAFLAIIIVKKMSCLALA